YSLGNHVFDQKYPDTKRGLLAECRIHHATLTCRALATRTPSGSAFPQWDETGLHTRAEEGVLARCAVPAHATVQVDGWQLRPGGEKNRLVTGPLALLGKAVAGVGTWQSTPRPFLSVASGQLAAGEPPLLVAMQRHFSTLDGENAPRPYVYQVTRQGLVARWRGSSLAWPLLDAQVIPGSDGVDVLCALHRADSFLQLDPSQQATRTALYRWKGFGFEAASDAAAAAICQKLYKPVGG
ncbi:MAG: CapA family protein, partial [Magnetococcales bacterium]|nr:CapA family protein [Magnetococcales bacterium]